MAQESLIDVTCPFCQAKWQLTEEEFSVGTFLCERCKTSFDTLEGKVISEKHFGPRAAPDSATQLSVIVTVVIRLFALNFAIYAIGILLSAMIMVAGG